MAPSTYMKTKRLRWKRENFSDEIASEHALFTFAIQSLLTLFQLSFINLLLMICYLQLGNLSDDQKFAKSFCQAILLYTSSFKSHIPYGI